MDPYKLHDRVIKKYSGLDEYSGRGKGTTCFYNKDRSLKNGPPHRQSFSTNFKRNSLYRFELRNQPKNVPRYLLWSNFPETKTYSSAGNKISSDKDLKRASSGAAGLSGGASSIALMRLLPEEHRFLFRPERDILKFSLRTWANEKFWCISRIGAELTHTYWIDRASLLIRRVTKLDFYSEESNARAKNDALEYVKDPRKKIEIKSWSTDDFISWSIFEITPSTSIEMGKINTEFNPPKTAGREK